jgi:calcineurin-like phosphoesterase family protein
MSMLFTSDYHLDHHNIMKHCNRPFNTVDAMNDTIIRNVTGALRKGDKLYFLGDLSMKKKETAMDLLDTLHAMGVITHIIRGNHDGCWEDKILLKYVKSVSLYKSIRIEEQEIFLCHYPMITWNKSHYGSWLLYGHHHSDIIDKQFPDGKMMNVSVDQNKFMPVSFQQVQAFMTTRSMNWDEV